MTLTTNLIETQSLLFNYPGLKPSQNRTRSLVASAKGFSQVLGYKLGEPRRYGQRTKASDAPAKTAGRPEPRDESTDVKTFEPGLMADAVESGRREPNSGTETSLDSGGKQPVETVLTTAVDQGGGRSEEPAADAAVEEQNLMALLGQLLLELSGAAANGDKSPAASTTYNGTALKPADFPSSANQPAASVLPPTAGSGMTGASETLLPGQRLAKILEQLLMLNSEGGQTAGVDFQTNQSTFTAKVSMEPLNGDTGSILSRIQLTAPAIPEETLQQLEKALTQLNLNTTKTGAEQPVMIEKMPAMAAGLTTADSSKAEGLRRMLNQMFRELQGSAAAAESDCTVTQTAEPPVYDPLPQSVRLSESSGEKTGLNQQRPTFGETGEKPAEDLKAADPEIKNQGPQPAQVSEGKPFQSAGEWKTADFDQANGLFPKPLDENITLSGKNTANKTQTLVKQVEVGMRLIQREARTEMNIQLQPESLGKLNLKVAVENGLVTARLVAESQSVGRLIEGSLGQLKQALHEQGLRFDRIEVAVGESSVQPDLGQQFTRHQHSCSGSSGYAAFCTYPAEVEEQWESYPAGPAVMEGFGDSGQIDFLA